MAENRDIRDFFSKVSGPGKQSSDRGNHRGHGSHRSRGRGHGHGHGNGHGRGRGYKMSAAAQQRRIELRAVSAETLATLPNILAEIDSFDPTISSLHHSRYLGTLEAKDCPGFALPADDPEAGRKGTRIRVYDQDTFDAALDLQPGTTVSSIVVPENNAATSSTAPPTQDEDIAMQDSDAKNAIDTVTCSPETSLNRPPSTQDPTSPPTLPVAILNLASDQSPGGGWLNGALAQEEALCYRSSLYLSLHQNYYPIPSHSLLYTPHCILIRTAMSTGHTLLYPSTPASDLSVTSVITMAALRRPEITSSGTFAKQSDVGTTKEKMRITLRIAALKGHRKIVLGAMGCGAFANPPQEVAKFFAEVFEEQEFQGGWWEDVVFAVLDNAKGDRGGKDGVGNFGVFYRKLDGVIV